MCEKQTDMGKTKQAELRLENLTVCKSLEIRTADVE
jgi:hypothetical protein